MKRNVLQSIQKVCVTKISWEPYEEVSTWLSISCSDCWWTCLLYHNSIIRWERFRWSYQHLECKSNFPIIISRKISSSSPTPTLIATTHPTIIWFEQYKLNLIWTTKIEFDLINKNWEEWEANIQSYTHILIGPSTSNHYFSPTYANTLS